MLPNPSQVLWRERSRTPVNGKTPVVDEQFLNLARPLSPHSDPGIGVWPNSKIVPGGVVCGPGPRRCSGVWPNSKNAPSGFVYGPGQSRAGARDLLDVRVVVADVAGPAIFGRLMLFFLDYA